MKKIIYAGLAAIATIGLTLPVGATGWVIDFDNNTSGPLAAGTVFGNLNGDDPSQQRYENGNSIPGSDGVTVNISVYSASHKWNKIHKAVGFDSSRGERGVLGNAHHVEGHDSDLDHSQAKHDSLDPNNAHQQAQHPDQNSTPFNNILIIQSSESSNTRSCPGNNCFNADDEAKGGDLTFYFGEDVRLFDMNIFDNEEWGGKVKFFDANDDWITSLWIPTTKDGGVTLMDFGNDEFGNDGIVARSMMVWVPGSFALDNLRGEVDRPDTPQVPEPGAAALFGIGLIGLTALRRRKRAA